MRKNKNEEEIKLERAAQRERELAKWIPSTATGKAVKNEEITSLDEIFDKNLKILEPAIVDSLVQDLEEKIIDFKKTAKVRRAGRQFAFRVSVLVGDKNAYVGLGTAKDKERLPAVRKATKNAKLNLVRVKKGCGSWECPCGAPHSVPFKVLGKSSSVRVVLLPAPKGTGLVVGDCIKDVLRFVGITDAWSKTYGNTGSRLDFVAAAIDALVNTTKIKIAEKRKKKSK